MAQSGMPPPAANAGRGRGTAPKPAAAPAASRGRGRGGNGTRSQRRLLQHRRRLPARGDWFTMMMIQTRRARPPRLLHRQRTTRMSLRGRRTKAGSATTMRIAARGSSARRASPLSFRTMDQEEKAVYRNDKYEVRKEKNQQQWLDKYGGDHEDAQGRACCGWLVLDYLRGYHCKACAAAPTPSQPADKVSKGYGIDANREPNLIPSEAKL
eukprot:2472631-Prymnesium_polylepis.1